MPKSSWKGKHKSRSKLSIEANKQHRRYLRKLRSALLTKAITRQEYNQCLQGTSDLRGRRLYGAVDVVGSKRPIWVMLRLTETERERLAREEQELVYRLLGLDRQRDPMEELYHQYFASIPYQKRITPDYKPVSLAP